MRGLKVVFSVVVFLFSSTYGWAEWYPGIIHAHSLFSDGSRQIFPHLVDLAKSKQARFLIVTDHYEQIDSETFNTNEKILASWSGLQKQHGFRNYYLQCAVKDPNLVLIPSVEIELVPQAIVADDEQGKRMHILALGIFKNSFQEIDGIIKKRIRLRDAQRKLFETLKSLGIISVVAHPTSGDPFRPGTYTVYPESPISGFEFFNGDFEKDLKVYLKFQEYWKSLPFVTAGCDSHHEEDPTGDTKRWKRKTYVFLENRELDNNALSVEEKQKAVLSAMAQGHTYAAQHGASLENLNYIPGFQVKEVDRARFVFGVVFETKTSSRKTVRIYRDGNLVPESVQTLPEYPKGMTKLGKKLFKFDRIDYFWEDKGVKEGEEHQYTIEVEGVLITSPIRLKVGKMSKEDADNVLATYVSTDEDEGVLELRKDNTCRAGRLGKWMIEVKRIPTLRPDGSRGETFHYTLIVMAEPLRVVEDDADYDRIIMAGPLRQRAGAGKQFISLQMPLVGDIEGETISDARSQEKLIRDKGAALVKSSEGKLWSSYFDQKDKFSWEFREDGSACLSKIGKWSVEGDVLTIQFSGEGKEFSVKCKKKDNTLVTEDGVVFVKTEGEKSFISPQFDHSLQFDHASVFSEGLIKPKEGKIVVGASIDKAKETVCGSNLRQIRIMIEGQKASGEPLWPTLQDMKLGSVGLCPVSKQSYQYEPAAGQVHCATSGHEKL